MNSHRKARKKAAAVKYLWHLWSGFPRRSSRSPLSSRALQKKTKVLEDVGSTRVPPHASRGGTSTPFKCQAGHLHTSASLLSKTNRRSPLSAWAGLPRCSLWTRRTNAHSDQSRSSCSIHLDIHMYSYLHQINNNA